MIDTLELPQTASAPTAEPTTAEWDVLDDDSGRYRRPRRSRQPRPPVVMRAFFGLLAVGTLLAAAAILLSDRAPGALTQLFGERARDLWERIDATGRADIAIGGTTPQPDVLVHVAIWSVLAVLVGFTVWSWRWLFIGASAAFATSVAIELAQGRYSDTRIVEMGDIVANGVGVVLGTVAVAACYVVWSLTSRAIRRLWAD